MANVLVTGGAGFIGSHLVDVLVALGHKVTVIDDFSSGNEKNLASVMHKIDLYRGDIRDDLSKVFEKGKFDFVFHLAAHISIRKSLEDPKHDAEINILGSLNLISQSAKHKVKKFIFSSSGGALYSSDAQLPCVESSKKEPLSPYALAKFTIENYLKLYKDLHGLDFVALRYSNVYGPRQNAKGEAGVIAIFSANALRGEKLKVFGSGDQTRDFIFVGDIITANLLAMERNLTGEFNVSTNQETSVNRIANDIIRLTASNSEIASEDAISGELLKSRLSYDKIAKWGWRPKVTFEDGLRKTVEWITKQ